VGYSILSLGCLFFFIPSLPEVLHSVHLETGINLDDPILNDKASGLYNTFFYLGSIIGPPIGGALNDATNFRTTNDIMAFICLGFAICYLIFNVLMIADRPSFPRGDSQYTFTDSQGGETTQLINNDFPQNNKNGKNLMIGREIIDSMV